MAENLIPGFGGDDPGRVREPNGEAAMAYGGQSSGGPHGLGPSHNQIPKVGKFSWTYNFNLPSWLLYTQR